MRFSKMKIDKKPDEICQTASNSILGSSVQTKDVMSENKAKSKSSHRLRANKGYQDYQGYQGYQ